MPKHPSPQRSRHSSRHSFLDNLTALHEMAHEGKDHTVRRQARMAIKKVMTSKVLLPRSLQPVSEFYAVSVVISWIQDMSVRERVKLAHVVQAMAHTARSMHTTIAHKDFAPRVRELQQRTRRLLKTVGAEVAMANMVAGM